MGHHPAGPGFSEPTQEEGALTGEGVELRMLQPDPELRAAALEIVRSLSLPRPLSQRHGTRRSGPTRTVRYDGSQEEIDIDATIEARAEQLSDPEIIMRDRSRARRSVVLAIDVSGSMRGERVRTAAATLAALASELAHDHVAILAFWSEAAWLQRLAPPASAVELAEMLLAIPAKGLTNIAFPLSLAGPALARSRPPDARTILLSDCVHNAGPDPRLIAAGLPRLDVLLDVTGEHDLQLARDLARLGRGRIRPIAGYREVASALTAIFAPRGG